MKNPETLIFQRSYEQSKPPSSAEDQIDGGHSKEREIQPPEAYPGESDMIGAMARSAIQAAELGATSYSAEVQYADGPSTHADQLKQNARNGLFVANPEASLTREKSSSTLLQKSKQIGETILGSLRRTGEIFLKSESSYSLEEMFDKASPREVLGLYNKETVARFEDRGFVSPAPQFRRQLTESDRTTPFRYEASPEALWNDDPYEMHVRELTEHEGLVALNDFFDSFVESAIESDDPSAASLIERARGMQERLTFIGEKEYQAAAQGIGDLWKSYLSDNPEASLCVLTSISDVHGEGSKRKSDAHMFEQIMDTFTDEELDAVGDRIIISLEEAKDKRVSKVILLDDWIISGQQMRKVVKKLRGSGYPQSLIQNIEINLVAGSRDRLEKGLQIELSKDDKPVPVKAYFRSHEASTSRTEHKGHVTGVHSSVDFDFEEDIESMVKLLKRINSAKPGSPQAVEMPPLTNIERTYRYAQPRYYKDQKGRIVRSER